MPVNENRRVVLVDDLRSFVDNRPAEVARTSAAGIAVLERYRDQRLDELWLDHIRVVPGSAELHYRDQPTASA